MLRKLVSFVLVLLLVFPAIVLSDSTHTCQGNADCSTGGSGGTGGSSSSSSSVGDITNTNRNTNNNSNTVYGGTGEGGSGGQGGSGGEGGSSSASANNSLKVKGSYSHAFASATGQSSVSIGSALFGSIGVGDDTRTVKLSQTVDSVIKLKEAGLLTDADTKDFGVVIASELVKEAKQSKCLGIVPCGKDRKIWNLFKLV